MDLKKLRIQVVVFFGVGSSGLGFRVYYTGTWGTSQHRLGVFDLIQSHYVMLRCATHAIDSPKPHPFHKAPLNPKPHP